LASPVQGEVFFYGRRLSGLVRAFAWKDMNLAVSAR
jgi:hypothetical protein